MQWPRLLALGIGGGAIAVWIAAAATAPASIPRSAPVSRAAAVETSSAALATEVARLHERLRPDATPTQARDLFRFGHNRSNAVAAGTPAFAAPAPVAVMEAAKPAYRLVGLAEDGTEHVRSAIISGNTGELFIVKEGDAVTERYRVGRIADDAVELIDTIDQSALRLGLP